MKLRIKHSASRPFRVYLDLRDEAGSLERYHVELTPDEADKLALTLVKLSDQAITKGQRARGKRSVATIPDSIARRLQ